MRSLLIVTILFFGCSLAFGQLPNEFDKNLTKEVKKLIRFETRKDWFEGEGLLVLVRDGDQVYSAGLGAFEDQDPNRVYDLCFVLGGVSKTMTAAAIRHVQNQGIDTDSVLQTLYPEISSGIIKGSTESLITHTLGFVREPTHLPRNGKGAVDYSLMRDTTWIGHVRRQTWKPSPHLYSHSGYAVLGEVYENVTGNSVSEWWARHSSSELCSASGGISRAGLTISSPREFGKFESSLGLRAKPGQLITWLDEMIYSERGKALTEGRTRTLYDKNVFVADAWNILDYENYPIALHSGRAGGNYVFMGFVRDTETGVILMSNCESGFEDLGNHILRMINRNWKKKPKRWGKRKKELE